MEAHNREGGARGGSSSGGVGGEQHQGTAPRLHPKVRDLWKRTIVIGREYPGGLDDFKRKAKAMFRKNAHLTDEEDILKVLATALLLCSCSPL